MSPRLTALVCFVMIATTGGVLAAIFLTESAAEQVSATKRTAMLVEVVSVERGNYRPRISAVGTVRPVREIMLSPRIAGQVLARSASFEPGGLVAKGEELIVVDPADFENQLAQRMAELHQAEADVAVEMGRQKVAEKDYALLDQDLPQEQRALVLRSPQLATVQAKLEAAQAAVAQAELELERTRVQAPFDALVLERQVEVGSQVARGQSIGRMVGLDTYWVVATMPRSELRWLQVPKSPGDPASSATLRNAAAWPVGVTREGLVERVIGELDKETRLARVMVAVKDPLARFAEDPEHTPPLMIGSFLEISIAGREVQDVVRLDRSLLRKENTVWVYEDGVLRVRAVQIAFRDSGHVYIEAGLEAGEQVVATDLSTAVDGSALRLRGENEGADANEAKEASE